MQNYRTVIAYDGTNYKGWQVQPNAETICSTLQKSFLGVFKKKAIILGASRTDSGVHALGQVARIKTTLNIDSKKMLRSWNAGLPKDIVIRKLEKVPLEFHPMFNVDYKIYYYNLFLKKPLPFITRYGWHYEFIDIVNLEKFKKALQFYVGKHDFGSFCKLDKPENTIRTIDSIKLRRLPQYQCLQVIVKGKSFLHFQVRRMIGYALDVARRTNLSVNFIKKILENPNPRQSLLKAAGCGLILRKIVYKK